MLLVSEVLPDVKRVLGGCDDTTAMRRLNDAVDILAAEAEWDSLWGSLDVVVNEEGFVTLPRQVETVLAVTVDKHPTQAHDFWFRFHLNGPGDRAIKVPYHWMDGLRVPVIRDPSETGATLKIELEDSADLEGDISVRVFGYDANGEWIRSLEGSSYVDGALVPIDGSSTTQVFTRITRVLKSTTLGYVRLYKTEDATDTLIGNYAPDERNPQYRRIEIPSLAGRDDVPIVRVAFRRRAGLLSQADDLIPLASKIAITLAVQALRKFDNDLPEEAATYITAAVRFMSQKQASLDVPGGPSIQVADQNLLIDQGDRMS